MHCIHFVRFKQKALIQGELESPKEAVGHKVMSTLGKSSGLGSMAGSGQLPDNVQKLTVENGTRGKGNTSRKSDVCCRVRDAQPPPSVLPADNEDDIEGFTWFQLCEKDARKSRKQETDKRSTERQSEQPADQVEEELSVPVSISSILFFKPHKVFTWFINITS